MADFFTMPNEERREAVNDDVSRYASGRHGSRARSQELLRFSPVTALSFLPAPGAVLYWKSLDCRSVATT